MIYQTNVAGSRVVGQLGASLDPWFSSSHQPPSQELSWVDALVHATHGMSDLLVPARTIAWRPTAGLVAGLASELGPTGAATRGWSRRHNHIHSIV